MKRLVLMVVMGVLMGGGQYSQAGDYNVVEFPVYTGTGGQTFPAIDGDIVVWIDASLDDNGPIHYKYLSTAQDCIIPNSQTSSWWGWVPAIDGDTIVWTDIRNEVGGDFDFYGYDLATEKEFVVWSEGSQRPGIDIAGNLVVGVETGAGADDYDIYGYELSSNIRFPISTAPNYQYTPVTNGNVVVWADRRSGNWDIYGYEVSSKEEFEICTRSNAQEYPAISGNIVVWSDNRNGNSDIYGYDLHTKTELPIFIRMGNQTWPSVSENLVVWQDDRNGDWDIYGFDLCTQTEFAIATGAGNQMLPAISGNTVVWMDDRNGDYDIYGAYIGKPSILTILTPNGGEVIQEGSVYEITWSFLAKMETVLLEYSIDNGQNWIPIDTILNTGSYEWHIPNLNSNQCLARISHLLYPSIMDTSDAVFTIFECQGGLISDLNKDCYVDLQDFALFSQQWLACQNPFDPLCGVE